MSPAQQEDSRSDYSQTSTSCLGPELKMDRPTTAIMGQQAAASIRNWILATRCHGRFFGRKTAEWPRNEPGTFQEGPGTARNGFRRVPERPRNEAGSDSPRWVDTMKTPTMWRSKYTARGYEEPHSGGGCFAATATVQGIRMLLARCLDEIRDTKLLWQTTHKLSSTPKSVKANSCTHNHPKAGTRRF